nr:hypothetical protein [Tanacetum cinerariifolium]
GWGWRWWVAVAAEEWGRRMMACGVEDRVDQETGIVFEFAKNARRKSFPAAAAV